MVNEKMVNNMSRLLSLSVAVFVLSTLSTLTWAQNPTIVTTDAEIRSAVQVNNANIQLGADINLSNSTLSIPANNTVTLDMNGHKLDRKLTQRGQGGGLFNANGASAQLVGAAVK